MWQTLWLLVVFASLLSLAPRTTAAPSEICSRDRKANYTGWIQLTKSNLKDNCQTWVAGSDPKTPDCVLRQGRRFALQSDLNVGQLVVPWQTSLHVTDCGPTSDVSLDVEHLIIDGSFRVGTPDFPFSGKFVLTLHVGKEIVFGDTAPRPPGLNFNNRSNFDGLDRLEDSCNKFIGVRPGGRLDIFGTKKESWTRLGMTARPGQKYICVPEPPRVLGWNIGDEIALSPTDFQGMRSVERHRIASITRGPATPCGGSLTHIGVEKSIRVLKYGNATVDGYDRRMSAEVANLNRNVVIQGALDDITKDPKGFKGYGGHTVFLYNSRVRMRNVELAYMGQANHMARYPVHWHLAANASESFFSNSVVRDSFQRCVTIHGTWGSLEVSDNVCYNITGHALYWENGIEVDTVVERNLVLLVKAGTMICSDNSDGLYTDEDSKVQRSVASDGPSAFWIVNGANSINNNVAAAVGDGVGQGIGYWFAVPQFIMEPSYSFFNDPKVQRLLKVPPYYPNQNPTTVPMRRFKGNVAHSVRTGFKADGILRSAGQDPGTCVKESAGVWKPDGTSRFDDFLVYKAQVGVWINSDNAIMRRPKFYDVARGLYIEKLQTFQQTKVPRSELPDCYATLDSNLLESCYAFYTTGVEEPGSFIRIVDSYFHGNSKNQLSRREIPGCDAYFEETNVDCRAFGQVGIMMSMGYAYFEGMTVEGFISSGGVNRGLFGHKEDPGYNAGPFYVRGVKYLDDSSPMYMDLKNEAGMSVAYKAGARNFMLYSEDGSLINPRDNATRNQALIALGKGVTVAPETRTMVNSRWRPLCFCAKEYGMGCLCPGDMRSVFVQTFLPWAQGNPEHSTVQDPTRFDLQCATAKRDNETNNWGSQHDCLQDSTIEASGENLNTPFLAQFAGSAVLGMPAINGTFVTHVDQLRSGIEGTEQQIRSYLFQLSQHPDQMRRGDYFIVGVYFPNISVASVRFGELQVFLDIQPTVQTMAVPACTPNCQCCPSSKFPPKPSVRPTFSNIGVLSDADYEQWKSDPSAAPINSPARRMNDAGAFPKEANSMAELKAGPAHGFFFDQTPTRQALYYKYSWVADTPVAKDYEEGIFGVDPPISFFVTFN